MSNLLKDNKELMRQWDYEKNQNLDLEKLTLGSSKRAWWKCKYGHSWEATIYHRSSGSGCIYCTKQKPVVGVNDLKTTNPELLEEWDYEKNGELKPENFMSGSNKKVWWKCCLGHSWEATINHRSNGTGCPHCYSEYGTSFPEQALLFYISKVTEVESRKKIDNQEIDIYLPLFNIGFEYDGSYYHETERSKQKEQIKNNVMKESGITLYHIKESNVDLFDKKNNTIFCVIDREYEYLEKVLYYIQEIINKKISNINIKDDRINIYKQYVKIIKDNNFTKKYPKLLKEWDYEKNNGLLPESITVGSNKKVWWICQKCGSSFSTSVDRRINYSNCPYCSGKKVNNTNSLLAKCPELSDKWDYEKNKEYSIDKIYYSSRTKVWWICQKCGKSYQMAICSRIKAKTDSCSDCKHKHIGNINSISSVKSKGSLFDNRPDLLEEWDYEKNYPLKPNDVTVGSGKKVWWKCSKCGNEWEAKIFNRSYGTGCPICNNKRN